jgi:hypothetical protein
MREVEDRGRDGILGGRRWSAVVRMLDRNEVYMSTFGSIGE